LYLLGVIKGDEIIKINNFNIKNLDSIKFNRYLNQIPIMLTFRSSRFVSKLNFFIKFFIKILRLNQPNNNRYSRSIVLNKNNEQIIFELIQTEKSYIHVSK